jgi:polysaccharide biosynthesis protein PslH
MSSTPGAGTVDERREILFLAKMFPWPLNSGARQRLFHLARGMASTHRVSMIVLDAPRPSAEVRALIDASGCVDVVIVPRELRCEDSGADRGLARLKRRIRSLDDRLRSHLPRFVQEAWSEPLVRLLTATRRSNRVDFIYATQSWMAEHARAAGFGRIIVDVDDVMSIISAQQLAAAGWSKRYLIDKFDVTKEQLYERSLPRRFEHVIVAKEDDLTYFRPADRARLSVVPNGVTLPPTPFVEARDSTSLLFVGTLGYEPNIEAVRWLATTIMPLIWESLPDAHLVIAGLGSGVHVADVLNDARCTLKESPPDLAPLYRDAALVVAPLRSGGGTRIKILEAFAFGRAVVSTEFAAEGLGVRDGIDVEFANTAADIASRVLALLRDADRRTRLASNARNRVCEHFDWMKIERSLPPLLARITAGFQGV